MPIIVNDGCHLLLVKDDGSEVRIGRGNRVQYIGNYYYYVDQAHQRPELKRVSFIGTICQYLGQQINQEYTITGVYITPEYVFIDDNWHKIVDYVSPMMNDFRQLNIQYPHLLVLEAYDHYYNYLPIDTFDSVKPNTVDLGAITKTTKLPLVIDEEQDYDEDGEPCFRATV